MNLHENINLNPFNNYDINNHFMVGFANCFLSLANKNTYCLQLSFIQPSMKTVINAMLY